MNPLAELRDQIRLYVSGEQPLEVLRDWLEDHVQAFDGVDDAEARRLDGLAWRLISELDEAECDEVSVRSALAAAIGAREVVHRSGDRQSAASSGGPAGPGRAGRRSG